MDLELSILSYLDGDLPEAQQRELEERLARDPAARQMLEEHRRLGSAMQRQWQLPAVQWDRLAERISAGVDAAAEQAEQAQRGRMRIGVRTVVRWAMAACILLGLTLGARMFWPSGKTGNVAKHDPGKKLVEPAYAYVEGPKAEAPTGPAVAEVEIGPAEPELASRYISEGVVVSGTVLDVVAEADPAEEPSF